MMDEDQALMYHGVAGDFSSTDAILSANSQDFGVINEQYLLNHEDDVFSLNESCPGENSYFTAPPLHELYRYHVFFSHSSEDRAWVEDIVYRLEAHPFYYKCYFCCTDNFHRRLSIVQSSLCAAMLSERVVIVLTRNYISKTWREFQDILKNLTNMSLYKQRMVIVKLEDCDIPEQLQVLGFMEPNDMDFFQTFVRKLRSDRLPRSSDSIGSDMSSMMSRTNLVNGQLLATLTATIIGRWKASLVFDTEDEVPTPLRCHGINLSYDEYMDILHIIGHGSSSRNHLSWIFTIKPWIVLLVAVLVWFVAFILVIVLLMDAPRSSALPVRLAVFLFPMILVVLAYMVRWKRKQLREKLALKMFTRCIQLNQTLFTKGRHVILATGHQHGNNKTFNLYFLHFNISECVISVENYLRTFQEEALQKLFALMEFYTLDTDYLPRCTMAEKLAVMLCAPYGIQLIFKLLPRTAYDRHTNQHQCLCQFVEEFVSEYTHCISDTPDSYTLPVVFNRYLNCKLRKESFHAVQELLTTPT